MTQQNERKHMEMHEVVVKPLDFTVFHGISMQWQMALVVNLSINHSFALGKT